MNKLYLFICTSTNIIFWTIAWEIMFTPTKLFLDSQMRAIMFSILPPNYVLYYRVREIMFSILQPNSFLDYRVREIMFSILPPNEILDYRVREITLIVLNVLLWCSLQDKLQLCLTFAENRSLRWRSYVFIHLSLKLSMSIFCFRLLWDFSVW